MHQSNKDLRSAYLIGVVLLVSACSSSHDFTLVDYAAIEDPIYPPIDVFRLTPRKDFREECTEFDKSPLNQCSLNDLDFFTLAQAIDKTGYFEAVELASRELPYSLAFSVANYDNASAGELSKAALAGATLLLVPVSTNALLKVEGLVMWHSEQLHEFAFDLPFTLHSSWATMSEDVNEGLSESIATHLIDHLEDKDIFEASFLNAQLGASDYSTLNAPEQIENFVRIDQTQLRDPFEGAVIRYEHNSYDGWVDVFVYPVRSWQYEDEEHLRTEIDGIRKDMQLIEKEGLIEKLKFEEDVHTIESEDGTLSALTFTAHYDLADQPGVDSRTFVSLKADKFVKVRATFGRFTPALNELESFAHALVELIKVPEESLFMARLRKQWRDQEKL